MISSDTPGADPERFPSPVPTPSHQTPSRRSSWRTLFRSSLHAAGDRSQDRLPHKDYFAILHKDYFTVKPRPSFTLHPTVNQSVMLSLTVRWSLGENRGKSLVDTFRGVHSIYCWQFKMNIHAIYAQLFKVWRRKRTILFEAIIEPTSTDIILDVGGYPGTWTTQHQIAKRIA